MANQKHIEWLKKGVESWNRRRQNEPISPELSRVDVYKIFNKERTFEPEDALPLGGIDLSRADLKGANLSGVNLHGANLSYSKLEDADLSYTSLENANLDSVSLNNGTKLYRSNLAGADLTGVELLSACLFPPPCKDSTQYEPPSDKYQKSLGIIDGVNGLVSVYNKIREHYRKFPHEQTVFYFRGERSDSWDLRPSVMRKSGIDKKEGELLSDLLSRCPEEFRDMTTALSQWVLAQHYGLKTRLLDITRNPLVGLFNASEVNDGQDGSSKDGRLHIFAIPKSFMLDVYPFEIVKSFNSDTVSVIMNFAKLSNDEKRLLLGVGGTSRMPHATRVPKYNTAMRRLYHFIHQEYPNFEKRIEVSDLFCVFVVEPQRSFERIRAQQGAFLISAFHERFEEQEILKHNAGIPHYHHYTVKVLHKDKQDILEELRLMNITRESLFPGLEEAANAVNRLHGRG